MMQECDGGLRNWLLTTVVVTAICGVLGALFHGRGDGTRPSRFLDEDDDVWGVGGDSVGVNVSSSAGGVEGGGMGLGSTEENGSSRAEDGGFRETPALKAEEGRAGREAQGARGAAAGGAEAAKGGVANGGLAQEGDPARRDSMGEDSTVS